MNYLFVYGTLCPNRENSHWLENIGGTWQKASVNGVVHILDWGPDRGLPAIVLDQNAPPVAGYCFSTEKLAQHWDILDEFEGMQYQRVQAMIQLESGEQKAAWVYEMKNAA
ncbi:gamma-glutamylcyclotransferase family protein [Acinetobacter tianfuensis]|uniref:Gamma-glutamylcyclotransferase n=1 Tax=Acinetobacter tianfuensis TaxID=2419603 RepID=A0A3A8EKU0_9GAMM|nr:gamma-glutamylcyclotransferase family protein [Acinetobacter tianfuensis]RKG30574.1 gamma-glutamylcyclotransferase [Acinetobacter tianfuensis]